VRVVTTLLIDHHACQHESFLVLTKHKRLVDGMLSVVVDNITSTCTEYSFDKDFGTSTLRPEMDPPPHQPPARAEAAHDASQTSRPSSSVLDQK
jgi:hypothetical protein